MISKKITREPENDCYRALALYVSAVGSHEREKLLLRWHAGFISDDFTLTLHEAEATQAMNTRTTREKTYHLMVSIRAEDEHKISPATWLEIEKTFAQALGFEEHQRHCGVHKNTARLHMHVAYNMIHPRTYNRHDPYYDYVIRDRVCRELERRYGISIDVELGEKQETGPKRGNDKARTVEAHSGQQSFDGYMQEHAAQFQAGLERCKNWRDFHALCAQYGVELHRRANGCVFKDRHGKHFVKGSSLGREFSWKALETRFGPFQVASQNFKEQEHHTARPLRGAERKELYAEYSAGIAKRKKVLDAIAEEQRQRAATIRQQWEKQKNTLEASKTLTHQDRRKLLASASQREREALASLRTEMEARRAALRREVPFTNWTAFLQGKTRAGDEMALAILRSKGQRMSPEREQISAARPDDTWQKKIDAIRADAALTYADKRMLIAVAKMHQLQAQGQPGLKGFTYTIDTRGTVLFHLASGGVVKDTGKGIFFSAYDPLAGSVAERFARLRFGPAVRMENGFIPEREAMREKTRGMSR